MAGVWYRSRALLRHHVGTTLLLVVMIALAGGVVIATVAGARRTADALPEFLEYYKGQDVSAFIFFTALPPDEEAALVDDILALPQWEAVGTARPAVVSIRIDERWITQVVIATGRSEYRTAWDRPIVVDGRLPDPSRVDEAAVNEPFVDALGLEVGDTFPLRTVTPAALDARSAGQLTLDPAGEDVTMTVAGIIRRPVDLDTTVDTGSQVFGSDTWTVEVGAAFLDRFEGRLANYGIAMQGRARNGQSGELAAAIADVGGPVIEVQEGNEVEEVTDSIQRGVDFERNALLVFALVTFVTAAALLGQVVGRQVAIDLDDDDVLRAAGLSRRHRAAVPLLRMATIATLGGIGAAMIAVTVSGVFPVGLARRAELDPGITVDPAVIAAGTALLVAAVIARAVVGAWRGTARTARSAEARPARVSKVTTALAAAGAPVPTVAGVRMALERGQGRRAVPVLGAVVATTAAVLLVTALLVLTTSIDRMVATPALQGWTWDTTVANLNDNETVNAAVADLRANPDVESFVGFAAGPIVVDGEGSYAGFVGRGDPAAGPEVTDGRLPTAADEVVVGRQTLAELGKEVGDRVELAAAPGAPIKPATIVGTATLPAGLEPGLTLGRGLLLTGAGSARLYDDGQGFVPNTFLVRFTDGTTTAEGIRSLRDDFPETTGRFDRAADVDNLARVQGLPRVLALLVALLGLGTLGNTLATSVRRRRRDFATLSALGLRRRDLGITVAWQATTFALVALLLGVTLGVAVGRATWRLLMDSIGTEVLPAVPVAMLALVAVGTLVAANVIAALPARSAARTHPAEILHSE